jgi:hypothetical protein
MGELFDVLVPILTILGAFWLWWQPRKEKKEHEARLKAAGEASWQRELDRESARRQDPKNIEYYAREASRVAAGEQDRILRDSIINSAVGRDFTDVEKMTLKRISYDEEQAVREFQEDSKNQPT